MLDNYDSTLNPLHKYFVQAHYQYFQVIFYHLSSNFLSNFLSSFNMQFTHIPVNLNVFHVENMGLILSLRKLNYLEKDPWSKPINHWSHSATSQGRVLQTLSWAQSMLGYASTQYANLKILLQNTTIHSEWL